MSGFDISGSASALEPRGLDRNGMEGTSTHVLGQPDAAAQEECGKRSVASYAEIFIQTDLFFWGHQGAHRYYYYYDVVSVYSDK